MLWDWQAQELLKFLLNVPKLNRKAPLDSWTKWVSTYIIRKNFNIYQKIMFYKKRFRHFNIYWLHWRRQPWDKYLGFLKKINITSSIRCAFFEDPARFCFNIKAHFKKTHLSCRQNWFLATSQNIFLVLGPRNKKRKQKILVDHEIPFLENNC